MAMSPSSQPLSVTARDVDSPEMINDSPRSNTLRARADVIIPTHLDRLINPPVPITEVGLERRPEMNPETFFGAKGMRFCLRCPHTPDNKDKTHNPIACAWLAIPSSVNTLGKLSPEMATCQTERPDQENLIITVT